MNKLRSTFGWLNVLLAISFAGCSPVQPFFTNEDGDLSHYLGQSTDISYPDLERAPLPEAEQSHRPFTTEDPDAKERWKLSLEQTLSIALQNTKVLRTLGGRVFSPVGQTAGSPPESLTINPDFAPTVYDPAIQETSNTGVEAALANFDAVVRSNLTWDRTDRPQNIALGSTAEQFIRSRLFEQDQLNYQGEVSKRTPSGTQFFWRNVTNYDSNNNPSRSVPSEWLTSFEMEARHPLLRGSGVQVNRVPVILARLNTDIAISDFEMNVRNFVLEVEQAYWTLYFHYHNLDAARTGFSSAHATWKQTSTRRDYELEGGEAANEAQARAQYFSFKVRLQQAKSDLLHQESRLRYLMGLAATDGRLIQPTDQPTKARLEFDWVDIKNEALVRSPELRRQKTRIKQQQLQLIGARNQLLPQFDAVALYRFLGVGDDLARFGTRSGRNFGDQTGVAGIDEGSLAFDNLTEGRFGEWRLGFTYEMPLGYRAELTQVRNSQLQLRRSEKRLEEQELTIIHQLSAAIRRLRDQYQIAQTQFNTMVAYRDQVESAENAYKIAQSVPLDLVLDAQSRQAQAEIDYFRALTEYNLAIAEVHHRKGSLLEHNAIALAEGPWPTKAYFDSQTRARQRDASYYLDYGQSRPSVVSRGPMQQFMSNPPIARTNDSASTSPANAGGDFFESDSVLLPANGQPVEAEGQIIEGTVEGDSIYGNLGL